MCDWEDAPSGDLPLTDGAYQGAFQFDDVFPYLGPPTPGSPNDRKERTANLIENWVVDPLFGKLGYLLDSGDPYILWSTEAAFSVPPMMDLYGTGSMATACCTSR